MATSKHGLPIFKRNVRRRILRKAHIYPIGKGLVKGAMYDIKVFPPSKDGRFGFKPPPGQFPRTTRFKEWFEYCINYIGFYVEELNALQFNLDEISLKPTDPTMHPFREAFEGRLQALVNLMQIGQSHNPTKLIWPLNGVYVCELEHKVSGKGSFRSLLIVSFEADPDYQLVTNCSVQLIQPAAFRNPKAVGNIRLINWDSSSSSSLATSSGGPRPG